MLREAGYLCVLMCVALAHTMTDIEVLTSKPKHCTYAYAYEMYGAHCAGLRINKIPSLKTSIEILDFSDNKLQEIAEDTFSSYTSLKFLYLSDNQIYSIHDKAFVYLTSLQTLDLSKNFVMSLPHDLLQLPSLRKLYLGNNPLIRDKILEMADNTKHIAAPLQLLDISECKISTLPEWGMLPQLLTYNISNNPLESIDAKYFAVMCSLRTVDLSNTLSDSNLCSIKSTMNWFREKDIIHTFQTEEYEKLNSDVFARCPQPPIPDAYNATFQRCKSEYSKVETKRTSRRTWLTITGGLAGFLVGFMLLLYLMHRHNVAQTKTAAEKKPKHIDGDKNSTAILLNNVS